MRYQYQVVKNVCQQSGVHLYARAVILSVLFGQIIDWLNHDMEYDIVKQFERYYELRYSTLGKLIDQHILNR